MSQPYSLHRAQTSSTLFKHRCVISTPAGTYVDAYGHVRWETEQPVHTNEPCFAWVQTERVENLADNTQASVEFLRLLVRRDLTISTADVVSEVANRRGEVLWSGPFRVVGVSLKGDSKVVMARLVDGGAA